MTDKNEEIYGSCDYISREAAIEAVQDEVEPFVIVEPGTTCVIGAGVKDDEVISVLEKLPSADVAEVVRCKDCKHFELDKPYVIQGVPLLGHEVCNAWGEGCKTDLNGFCFMGERREDATF